MTETDLLDTLLLLEYFISLTKTETETAFVIIHLSLDNYNPNSELYLGVCTSDDLILTLKSNSGFGYTFVAYDSDDGS